LTAVALGDAGEMIDELPGSCAEPAPWSGVLHPGDEFLQPSVGVVAARRRVFTIRVRCDLAGDAPKEIDVP